jgi:hypothetical protein
VECSNCSVAFCDGCFASIHAKGKLKSHTKAKLGETQKPVLCVKHDKKEIEIHCKTCSTDICSLCVLAHSGHALVPLIEFANSSRGEIEKGAHQLSARAKKLNEAKRELDSCLKQIKEVNCTVESAL